MHMLHTHIHTHTYTHTNTTTHTNTNTHVHNDQRWGIIFLNVDSTHKIPETKPTYFLTSKVSSEVAFSPNTATRLSVLLLSSGNIC